MELRPGSNQCECTACGEFFWSVTAFDKHQVGPDIKRCLSPEEMRARGMSKNKTGYWIKRAFTGELPFEGRNTA